MAGKKYYAVKKGKITGIFASWKECRPLVEGYSGAEYKGFATKKEAQDYLDAASLVCRGAEEGGEIPPPGSLLAYVDGSYDDKLKRYAFGCVFIFPDGRIYTEYGNGSNEQSLRHRNVTGEMLGAMYAVRFAIKNGFSSLEIRYDYEGIERWVTGAWNSKTELTKKYAEAMRRWSSQIEICFTKVAAHTNVLYNELADQLAKKGLTEGNGVPPLRLAEEMEQYHGTDPIK